MNDTATLFRLLGDPLRLRMLRLLAREQLNVSELTSILGAAQSGISRNLKLLKEGGLLQEKREGGWAHYGADPKRFPAGMASLWGPLQESLRSLEGAHEDDVRLEEVLRQRHEEFRESGRRGMYPGRSWAAWARTLSYLAPPVVVADLGCGEGYLTLEVARWARKVLGIDESGEMLDKAKALAKKVGVTNIQWKKAKLEHVPLPDRSVDVVLVAQVLHVLQDPSLVLREAYRILKPGGTILIQELRTHQEAWVRDRFGDVRLGYEPGDLKRLLAQSQFKDIRIDIGAKRHGDPFTVLIGCGRRKS